MKTQKDALEKRSLTEKVLCIYVAGFLDPNLDAGNMIAVFDLVEQNPDGESRIRRLIEEDCTIKLTPRQIEEAIELLND